jgi:hypothetical protein
MEYDEPTANLLGIANEIIHPNDRAVQCFFSS